jgi:ketosteroid isomerase-like protein
MAQIADGNFFEQITAGFLDNDPNAEAKSTEAARIHTIQVLMHAIARNAFEEIFALTSEDFTFEVICPPHIPLGGRWQGRAEVLAALKRNFALVAEQHPQIQTVTAQGDNVVIIATETGQIRATGKTYEVTWVQEYTFRNGVLSRIREIVGADAKGEFA